MIDWASSMQHHYEYYIVDPISWNDVQKLDYVKSSDLTYDLTTDTILSSSIELDNLVGECYIRIYLVVIQNGEKESIPLGTVLVQTPESSYNGIKRDSRVSAYSPLTELKDNQPPLGYSLPKGANVLDSAYNIMDDHIIIDEHDNPILRAPVVRTQSKTTLSHIFAANVDDTWLTYIRDLVANDKKELHVDSMGHVIFAPKREVRTMQPVWEFNDGNSSILYPEIKMNHDLYAVPNVLEVIYSSNSFMYKARAINDDPNSPTSIQRRGRIIKKRLTNPNMIGVASKDQVQDFAERTLKELSTVTYSVSFTHAYCPVRPGDCVLLNYKKAGIEDIKAKIITQNIKCVPGCPVSEKAIFTANLWG